MANKNLFLSSLLLILVCFFCTLELSAKSKEQSKLVFETTKVDIGEVKLNTVTTIEFNFKNKGKHNLYIYKAIAGCPCISVEYPKEPFAKGKKGKIIVKFDSTHMHLGSMQKNVAVMSNSPEGTQHLVFNVTVVN